MTTKNWYKKAVNEKPPYTLGGWKKTQPQSIRRRRALASRLKNLSLRRKYLSAGRALQALANVTKDISTKLKARSDAEYFFKKLK